MTDHKSSHNDDDRITQAVARIHARVLAFVFAVICGIGLFGMTVWLLIKDGENAGPHLRLLGQYFIGYSVTWTGSLIGLVYGAAIGWIIGWAIGMVYNKVVSFRSR